LLSFAILAACRSASSDSPSPIAIGALVEEYGRSSAAVRSRYDGKEITVRGYAPAAATMPRAAGDQGAVVLQEKDDKAAQPVTCWFSREQASEFSKIKGNEYVTVKGIFTGEVGAELKFCKLVKVE
jgi:tRNA_anti-like